VILDWVPSHFPADAHGLRYFDGTAPVRARRPAPGLPPGVEQLHLQLRPQRGARLPASSALFWLDRYHIDGLRVDAVASMLYLDYGRARRASGSRTSTAAARTSRRSSSCASSTRPVYASIPTCRPSPRSRPPGRWCRGHLPRRARLRHEVEHGLDARHAQLLRARSHPPQVPPRPADLQLWYAFNENFVLPLSHDEVVHGKGSLLGKMPGDDWQKFANLRLLLGYMYATRARSCCSWAASSASGTSGTTTAAWTGTCSSRPPHAACSAGCATSTAYRDEPALHERDFEPEASSGWTATTPSTACSRSCATAAAGDGAAGGVQLHAGAAAQLPRGRAARRALARAAEQRRRRSTAAAARATWAASSRPRLARATSSTGRADAAAARRSSIPPKEMADGIAPRWRLPRGDGAIDERVGLRHPRA
jgi:hypothetical protein